MAATLLGDAFAVAAIHWQSAVDLAVLGIAIYLLLWWSREARALRLALTILALHAGALVTRQLGLLITGWVLEASTIVALVVLVVGFQPELRRAVMRLDLFGRAGRAGQRPMWEAVAGAAAALANDRCGALMIIVQNDSIEELVTGGVTIAARVSPEILQAIFHKGSPIHDGAVVIDGDQLISAKVFLPLTQRLAPAHYGTRHRAGLGLSERSDAIVVVVSEERGDITVMHEGHTQLLGTEEALVSALKATASRDTPGPRRRWPAVRAANVRLGGAAIVVSVLIWTATFLVPGRSVRVQTVPVEFTRVPPGLTIAAQSAEAVQVWMRASDVVFDSVNLSELVERCDLASAHEGVNVVHVSLTGLDVPPGIRVDSVAPHDLSVRLVAAPANPASSKPTEN